VQIARTVIEASLSDGYRDEIQNLIGDDLVTEALDKLQDFARDLSPDHRNDVLRLRRTFTSYSRDIRRGVGKREDIEPVVSRILELADAVHKSAEVKDKYRLGGASAFAFSIGTQSVLPQPMRNCPALC
jgi:hypothetical protein